MGVFDIPLEDRENNDKARHMITITLPLEIEGQLLKEARQQGITPEPLALDYLRERFTSEKKQEPGNKGASLFDFLSDHVGVIDGTTEALSENCGQRFSDGLLEQRARS